MSDFLFPRVVSDRCGYGQSVTVVEYDLEVHRSIYLCGEIDDRAAQSAAAQLRYLDAKSDAPITMFINSPGGFAPSMLALYDCMTHGIRSDISTVAIGRVASTAVLLLAAGAKGSRFAAPNAEIMLRLPCQNDADAAQGDSPRPHSEQFRLASLLAAACGKQTEEVVLDMGRGTRLSAGCAKEYGLVDQLSYPTVPLYDPDPFFVPDDADELPFWPGPLLHETEQNSADSDAAPDKSADTHGVLLLAAGSPKLPLLSAIREHTQLSFQEASSILRALPHRFSFPDDTAAAKFIAAVSDAGGIAIFDLAARDD